jgi:hypothetical protein
MHVSSSLDAIKKRGTFKAYKGAHKANVEQKEVAKQAKAAPAFFTAPTSESKKASKKASDLIRSLQRNPLRRRRLPRRPRKVRLWLKHQPQNFTTSTRPSTTRPLLQM